MSEQSTTVAPKSTLQQLITSDWMKQQLAMALPKICTADRFMRVALTALNKTPKLLDCTKQSVLACLIKCAELGLEPDGRRAHLIPFKDTCTVIIDYKGIAELAMRSGTVSYIHADKICDQDIFEYNKGKVDRHSIDFRKDRGKAYAYYCIIVMKDSTEKAEVMTLAEIEGIRKRSKAGDSGPWVTDFDEMAKKTVFRRASKWVTLSPELRASEDLEDEDHPLSVPIALEIPEKAQITDAPKAGSEGLAAAASTAPEVESISKNFIKEYLKKGDKAITAIVDTYLRDTAGKALEDCSEIECKQLLSMITKSKIEKAGK
jgi:recombination protein RecT